MPTNREWIEHTERAAWDTVQSLRRQIEEERARVLRLTPVRESWHRIIEVLDVAKAEHGITAEHYADVVDALAAALRKAKEEREHLAYKLKTEQKAAEGAGQRVEMVPLQAEERPPRGIRVRWFSEKIAALRKQQLVAARGRKPLTLERLVGALEAKVDELSGATGSEVARIAVELGALALRAADLAERRKGGHADRLDEEEEE
jgi:hypothetical protein